MPFRRLGAAVVEWASGFEAVMNEESLFEFLVFVVSYCGGLILLEPCQLRPASEWTLSLGEVLLHARKTRVPDGAPNELDG